jgi:hypothetical protein
MLKQLGDDGRIEVLSNSALGTHLKIVNYESYQDFSSYRKRGLGTDLEQIQNKSKAVKPVNNKQADALWAVWLEELSPKPPHPRLTEKRKSVLVALYNEQLTRNGTDPLALFRKVLKAVRGSSHHMGTRAYQLPESLFRSEERRESWTHRALVEAKAPNRTPTVSRDWSVEQ